MGKMVHRHSNYKVFETVWMKHLSCLLNKQLKLFKINDCFTSKVLKTIIISWQRKKGTFLGQVRCQFKIEKKCYFFLYKILSQRKDERLFFSQYFFVTMKIEAPEIYSANLSSQISSEGQEDSGIKFKSNFWRISQDNTLFILDLKFILSYFINR